MALCARGSLRHFPDNSAVDDQKRNRLSSLHSRFARRRTNAAGRDCRLWPWGKIWHSSDRRGHHETGSWTVSSARLLRHALQAWWSWAWTGAIVTRPRGHSFASVLVCGSDGAARFVDGQAGTIALNFDRSSSYTFAGGTGQSATNLGEHAYRVTHTRYSYVFAG